MSTTDHLGCPFQPGAAPEENLDPEPEVLDPEPEELTKEPEKPKAAKKHAKAKTAKSDK